MEKRVLIVDDDETITQLLARLIEDEAGEVVVVAESGIRAIDHLARGSFALIFLDLRMPGGDGQSVIDYLASVKREPKPTVLVLSAVADDNTQLDETVVTAIIRKPFDPHNIAAVVRRYLGKEPT
ncbi:MAG: response regulator [Acidobacteria bacterium]|nr:response regulator [Acidobacteriota bacterium]